MRFDQAFAPGRAIKHGIEDFKLAPVPLFVGGFIMAMTEGGGGGGGGNFPSSTSGDYGYDDYDIDWGNDDFGDYDLGGGLGDGGLLDQPLTPLMQSPSDLMGQFDFSDPAAIGALVGGLACVACVLVLAVAFFLLRAWVHTGWIRLHKEVIETGAGNFGTLFSGADRLMQMVLWKLLSGVIGLGTLTVAALPGAAVAGVGAYTEMTWLMVLGGVFAALLAIPVMIYVGLGLYLGTHALVLEEVGPMGALERSWGMARGNRVTLFIYGLVMGLAALVAVFVGLLMCCVGLIFTVPAARAVVDTGLTESYLMATRGEDAASKWSLVEIAGGLY